MPESIDRRLAALLRKRTAVNLEAAAERADFRKRLAVIDQQIARLVDADAAGHTSDEPLLEQSKGK